MNIGGLKKPAIKLSFIDNGEGICPEYREKIFDPFFTTKAPGKGTGLGLWVSLMIIEGFGGKIGVDSSRRGRYHHERLLSRLSLITIPVSS